MPRTVQYLIFCWLLALTVSSSTQFRSGYPRSNRGFKSQGLSTARGFGKRDPGLSLSQGAFVGANGHPDGQGTQSRSQSLESLLPSGANLRTAYPNSWLIEEIKNNPDVARLIVEKIVDENGDGELSPDELSRRMYY